MGEVISTQGVADDDIISTNTAVDAAENNAESNVSYFCFKDNDNLQELLSLQRIIELQRREIIALRNRLQQHERTISRRLLFKHTIKDGIAISNDSLCMSSDDAVQQWSTDSCKCVAEMYVALACVPS